MLVPCHNNALQLAKCTCRLPKPTDICDFQHKNERSILHSVNCVTNTLHNKWPFLRLLSIVILFAESSFIYYKGSLEPNTNQSTKSFYCVEEKMLQLLNNSKEEPSHKSPDWSLLKTVNSWAPWSLHYVSSHHCQNILACIWHVGNWCAETEWPTQDHRGNVLQLCVIRMPVKELCWPW